MPPVPLILYGFTLEFVSVQFFSGRIQSTVFLVYFQRGNAHGKDLNRNFPDRKKRKLIELLTDREPETKSLMKFILENPFVLSANLHGGAIVSKTHHCDDFILMNNTD